MQRNEIKKFCYSLAIFSAVYILYKLVFVGIIFFISQSKYNVNANSMQPDYGKNGPKRVIIAGSSNVRYDFDYDGLNNSDTNYSYRSCSASAPYGLYFTIKKTIAIARPSDKIFFDLPYTLYSRDQFLPMDEYTLGLMTLGDYKNVFNFSPRLFGGYVLQESFCNPEVWSYFSAVWRTYKTVKGNPHVAIIKKTFIDSVEEQNFGDEYNNCTNQYLPERHYIRDVELDNSFLISLKNFISSSVSEEKYFLYPEINKGNNSISGKTQRAIFNVFKPVNFPAEQSFENKCMFDQNYHLNKCGAELNTEHFRAAIKNL